MRLAAQRVTHLLGGCAPEAASAVTNLVFLRRVLSGAAGSGAIWVGQHFHGFH